jgi:hypothetical protein
MDLTVLGISCKLILIPPEGITVDYVDPAYGILIHRRSNSKMYTMLVSYL